MEGGLPSLIGLLVRTGIRQAVLDRSGIGSPDSFDTPRLTALSSLIQAPLRPPGSGCRAPP